MFKQLREDIACILERDPAARSRIEILTCYPGLHAIIIHRMAHALWVQGWHWAGRFTSHIGRLLTGIEIHPGAHIGRRVFIDHGFGVVIGETAEVGNDCTIYQGVTLGGTKLYKGTKRHPTLEEGVVVGAGAQILGGFTVGAHARVGSNAVVIKPVPAGATAVGNPARVILHHEDRAAPATEHAPAAKTDETANTPQPAWQPGGPGPLCGPDATTSSWSAQPLKDLLQSGRNTASASDETGAPNEEFAPYGVGRGDDDPLVKALHELINHTAEQDDQIHRLCQAMEELGQRIENGRQPLDADRLNRMVE
ncbi:MAG TPA: serine O-acetyltransferase [Castellaniella sp.]|uniref:serine O-acetyltransferase n=1 Tax=Castellaniella sp. TaxID=1955812 RepID=UPI002EFE6ADF